jgi:hypothetical protein
MGEKEKMKPFQTFYILVLTFSIFAGVFANAKEDVKVELFRHQIFELRVRNESANLLEGLKQCQEVNSSQGLRILINDFQSSLKQPPGKASLLKILEKYQFALGFKNDCVKFINAATLPALEAERSIFRPAYGVLLSACPGFAGMAYSLDKSIKTPLAVSCIKALRDLWQDLDPHCFRVEHKDMSGFREDNACYAITGILAKSFYEMDPELKMTKSFLSALYNWIDKASAGSNIEWLDLESVLTSTQTEKDHEAFLVLISTLKSAGTSQLGHPDDFSDVYWKSPLALGSSPEEAYDSYMSFKRKIDLQRDLMLWAKNKKLTFSFAGHDLAGHNRHTYIAAFLSCRYKSHGYFAARAIPSLLGAAYELKDFVSHRNHGASYQSSLEGFKVDTRQYLEGSQIGLDLCR